MSEYINELLPYMLTCKNISKYTRYIEEIKHIPKNKKFKNTKPTKSIFIPYQQDKLFWIFYYINKGYIEYNMIGSNSYSVENEEKIKLIDDLKKNKSVFKDYKLRKIGDNINEVLSTPELSFKTFELICILNNISFIIIKDNMYHKIIFDDCNDIYIIHVVNNMYGCERITKTDLSNYEINRYEVVNYDKPISCIGSFNSEQLIDVAKKLDISNIKDDGKKMTKQELYLFVYSKVNSFFNY